MRLILIEDEPFIALDLEWLIIAHGHEVVGVAADLAEALRLAADGRPDAAFVDINLKDGRTGVEICRRLTRDHGVQAAFVTGNAEDTRTDMAGALMVVEKPYTPDAIEHALTILEQAVLAA